MEIIYSDEAQKDINYWIKSGNKAVQKKISRLLVSIEISPFEGIGKPEPLKHNLNGLGQGVLQLNTDLYMKFRKNSIL